MSTSAYLLTRDLFFRVKIETAANAAGVDLRTVDSESSIPPGARRRVRFASGP